MRPPFAYHGGKARLAATIVSLMPPHRVYCEPFAGSLAVLLAKPRVGVELVGDTNGDLVNFWKMLRDRPDDLAAACELTPYARAEYDAAFDEPTDDPIEQARRWWVRVQQGVAHKVGTKSGWQCSASDGRGSTSKASTVLRKVRGLPEVAERLAGVMIDHRSAQQTVPMMDGPHTLTYCDPPYVASTHDVRGGGPYEHGMTDDDHRELADVLQACEGAVLLSGYASPLYEDLYDGWHRIELRGRADTANRSGTTNARTEVVWSNRPLREQLRLGDDAEVPA